MKNWSVWSTAEIKQSISILKESDTISEAVSRIKEEVKENATESSLRHAFKRNNLDNLSLYVAKSKNFHKFDTDPDIINTDEIDTDKNPPTARSMTAEELKNYIKADDEFKDDIKPLKSYSTLEQTKAIDSLLKYGSIQAAAEALEVEPQKLRNWIAEAQFKAARVGWSPKHDMTKTVPLGFHVKGVSTYYSKGEPVGQWVKSARDQETKLQQLLDALQILAEPLKGIANPVPPPKYSTDDLLSVYPMGDPHFGMFAWAKETGGDFDLKIAETNLRGAVEQLVSLAPPSKQALIINLGDFFHTDNSQNRTMRSGHPLDVDTRYTKMMQVGLRTMQACIDTALQKHEYVRVINEIGNHDDHSSIMLSFCLDSFYHREPRVEIDCSPEPFHWHRFGRCLLGVTHGDGPKIKNLAEIMAADRKEDWGETDFRYWYTGHIHQDRLIETPGCLIESFRTLAPRDNWSHRSGYRSGRDMKCDILHRQYGRINRHIVGIEQLITDHSQVAS